MKNLLKAAMSFLAPKMRTVLLFVVNQGITTAGNLIYGFLCLRLLPSAEYAKFVVLFGVQNTFIILMDVNFSNSLTPLVGERIHDRQLIADYLASLRYLAQRLYWVVGLGLVLCYPQLVKNRQWSWQTVAAMIATLLVSTSFARIGSQYGAVLVLLRHRHRWYHGQLISSLGTLALLLAFWACHWVTAFAAILINLAGIVFVGIFYFYSARSALRTAGTASAQKRKAIISLALPNVPQTVFYALQGQLSLYLITIFGHTAGVASVGALARLGQVFNLFYQMLPILLEPYFAKLPKARLARNYALAVGLGIGLSAAVTALSHWYPALFLWILGPQYANLRVEVLLSIAASSLSFVGGVLWCIHSARRFIYWWQSILNIFLTLAVQIAFIVTQDLSTVRSVLRLNLATACVYLFVNALAGVFGFTVGPRLGDLHPAPLEPGVEPAEAIEVEESKT